MREIWEKYKYWLIGLTILVSALVIWLKFRKTSQKPPKANSQRDQESEQTAGQKVMQIIKKTFGDTEYEGMIPLFYAQAYHETGGFTSRAYLEQNNLFGMKEAKVRETTDIDSGMLISDDRGMETIAADKVGYSDYQNLEDSAEDMLFYLEDQNFPVIVFGNKPKKEFIEEYAKELKRRKYFQDSVENYVMGMYFAKI